MVIMSVSKSNEKAMLNTVRVLRRLLRNAFLVTNRVSVTGELQGEPGAGNKRHSYPSPPRIDEVARHRQPGRPRFSLHSISQSHRCFCSPDTFACRPCPQVEIVISGG